MIIDNLNEKMERIKAHQKALKDFGYFAKEVLGFKKNEEPPMNDLTPDHDELCEFLNCAGNKLILMPRGTYKSWLVTVGFSLWNIIKSKNIRILIYSDSATKAVGFLVGIKAHIEGNAPNSKFSEWYPGWGSDLKSGKWNENEIIVAKREYDLLEPTVDTGGIESTKVGKHYDLIIFDDIVSDQNITTKAQMDKVYDCYKKALSLLMPNGQVVLLGCLVSGSKVLMGDKTYKDIELVEVGEKVYSYKEGDLVLETVEAMIPQGQAEVFELKTGNTRIEATPNHPFLNERGEFVRLDQLKVGDRIVLSGLIEGGENPIRLNEEDCWSLGFMFGDGWITHHPNKKNSMRWVTCFAKGVDEELNNKVLNYFEKEFNTRPKLTDFGYYRTEVAQVGRHFETCGLIGKAKTKRVPDYVFKLPLNLRLKFLEGFLSADGHLNKNNQYSIEICNKDLIRDLKHLGEISGYIVSNIYHRQRVSQPPHSPEKFISDSYSISFSKKIRTLNSCRLASIRSIKSVGVKEVYDLTISNTHNFISEGMVVHNTRWHQGDTYGRIIKDNEERRNFDIFIRDAEARRNGSPLFHTIGLTQRFLNYQRQEQGSYLYSALYRNSPTDDRTALFKIDNFKFYSPTPGFYENMYITGTCDPAGEGDDFTAMTVCGMDCHRNIYILDCINKHLKPNEIIDTIIKLNFKWKFNKFAIEKNFYAGMLQKHLKEDIDKYRENDNFKIFSVEEIVASKTQTNFNRVLKLQPFFEQGRVFFPATSFEGLKGDFSELAYQIIQFTGAGSKSPHDDLVIAFSFQTEIIRPGGAVIQADAPPTSAVWYEKKMIDSMNSQGRIPRKYRQIYKPVF